MTDNSKSSDFDAQAMPFAAWLTLGFDVQIMSYTDWLALSEPEFFDQEGESDFLVKHAASLHYYSIVVSVVRVNNQLFKLNGKRRKEAWINEELPRPDLLTLLIFNLSDRDFRNLCKEAKSQRIANLPAHELVKHAYAEVGLVLVSDRLKNGYITEAIHIALRGKQRHLQNKRLPSERHDVNIQKAIDHFKYELSLIDGIAPRPEIFSTGVLAGALIMLGMNKNILVFLERLNEGCIEERNQSIDPVGCLLKAINRHQLSNKSMQARMAIDLCKKTIHAIKIWLEGVDSPRYWRMRDLSGHELMPIIKEMKQLKEINEERDL
jgi:hypothetical protein